MDAPYKLKRPADLESYILRVVADKTYLIFERKKKTVFCTRCGKKAKTSEAEYLNHKVKAYCPFCGEEAIAIEKRYGRKNLTEFGRILWFRKAGRVTFAQLDEYDIDYTGEKPKVYFWPSAQYRFCKESQEYYKHTPAGYWWPDDWERRKNIQLPAATGGLWNYYKVPRYQKTVTHTTSIISSLGTDLKYANMNMMRFGYPDPHDPYALISYIRYFLKYQSIELLEKAGFTEIVKYRINFTGCSAINWRATDLRKILKLNAAEMREFRESGGKVWMLEIYQCLRKMGQKVPFEIISKLTDYNLKEKLTEIGKYVKIEKALKYLNGQGKMRLGDYTDYLKECSLLGYDMKNKKILFPENLQQAHETTLNAVRVAKDEIREREFKKGIKKVYDKPEFTDGHLLIRPAESIDELCEESKALCHCVRTYADKVCSSRCAILFVRKAEEPDLPYYTLELSPKGDIVQCRGNHNCDMTDDVKAFVKLWHETVVMKKKKGKAA